jgi:hypothetical protein
MVGLYTYKLQFFWNVVFLSLRTTIVCTYYCRVKLAQQENQSQTSGSIVGESSTYVYSHLGRLIDSAAVLFVPRPARPKNSRQATLVMTTTCYVMLVFVATDSCRATIK